MLFQRRFLEGIRDGSITLAFRRWRRPSVKSGGTLLTAVGELTIVSVARVEPKNISEADARCAGYDSCRALLAELDRRVEGDVYRIELGPLRPDPRLALRESASLTGDELRALSEKLSRMDRRATDGPWTSRTLEVIQRHPGVRAGDLCLLLGQDKLPFKLNVRKLKSLGLTESLPKGYRLSPRGVAVMRALDVSEAEC